MEYLEFLERCQKRAGIESKSEMARRMDYNEKSYINITNGAVAPGREVLEAAAKVAGFSFKDCIHFPDEKPVDPEDAVKAENFAVYDTVRRALNNWKRSRLIQICLDVETWKRPPQHLKGGGRKKSKPD